MDFVMSNDLATSQLRGFFRDFRSGPAAKGPVRSYTRYNPPKYKIKDKYIVRLHQHTYVPIGRVKSFKTRTSIRNSITSDIEIKVQSHF